MNAETFIKAQLAALAINEGACHGGVGNMVAVANVMKNRVEAGWYGGDWMEVLRQAPARSAYTYTGAVPPISLRDVNVRALLNRIDDIYDGSEADELTSGALYYCELHRTPLRTWFRAYVLQDREAHPIVATVGPVSFLS